MYIAKQTSIGTALIRFDPRRRAGATLKQRIRQLSQYVATEERRLSIRQRARRRDDQRGFELAMEVIACNLLVAAMVEHSTRLAVPRSHEAMWGRGRYRDRIYGQHFLSALDLLEKLELIVQVAKGYRYSPRATQPTTVVPSAALPTYLPLGQTNWSDFEYTQADEPIVLKARKTNHGAEPASIDYEDTAATRRWRRQVRTINAALRAAPISIAGAYDTVAILDRDGQPIEPYRRSLRRVFNNDSWSAGGRLFGGFWMTMRRVDRFRLIRIGSEEIANVDYSSLFPRLAYVRAGADQPVYDLYDILGDGNYRDGWKRLTNALLFAAKPLRGWPEDAAKEFPKGTKLKDAIDSIRQRHAPIAPLFERGLGFELMRHESDLLISVVTGLFKQGITALPLHDSVLVARPHAERAKTFMEQEFMHRTGASRAFVRIDFGQ